MVPAISMDIMKRNIAFSRRRTLEETWLAP